jgi:uncharacterized protein with ParB-like and HNH nuclease domain
MENNELELRTIYDLLGLDFFIPDYQRGYRWQRIQVKNLLDDIWNFKDNCKKNDFYCLQPIVVIELKNDDKVKHDLALDQTWYEVIDGQQRLTTIRIILTYLVKEHLRRTLEEAYPTKKEFTLKYATRTDSQQFLDNIQPNSKNIDYFHISEAYDEVKLWFKDKNYNDCNKFLEIFIAKKEDVNSVQVVWYNVKEPGTNPIEIFTRINMGKIPLTNAELVKALFLQKNNFTDDKVNLKQLQIASEWDTIEKTLQDDEFWYFIYNPDNPLKYDNRIEYIFDLMKNKKKDHEFYYTFNEFQKDFTESKVGKEKPEIDKIWLATKQYFLSIEEWFKDPVLYHLIGFLIDCNYDIDKLRKESTKNTKDKFKIYLKAEISDKVKCQVDDLEYNSGYTKKVLLLFNIQTILASKKAEMRFPFYKYKDDDWDIEHVRSQTEKQITASTRKDWALDVLEYFTGENGFSDKIIDNTTEKAIQKEVVQNMIKIQEKDETQIQEDIEIYNFCKILIEILESDKIDEEQFNRNYDNLSLYFNEKAAPININSISNLALLDSATNRSYKNAMFPIKRKRIIQNDMNGIFVPICTKNLFLKFYSKKMGDVMYWKDSDAADYLNAIKKTLKDYLPIQN